MKKHLVCAECGVEDEVEEERIFSLMDGKPDGRKKLWKIRWVEDQGPQTICPDEAVDKS